MSDDPTFTPGGDRDMRLLASPGFIVRNIVKNNVYLKHFSIQLELLTAFILKMNLLFCFSALK